MKKERKYEPPRNCLRYVTKIDRVARKCTEARNGAHDHPCVHYFLRVSPVTISPKCHENYAIYKNIQFLHFTPFIVQSKLNEKQ